MHVRQFFEDIKFLSVSFFLTGLAAVFYIQMLQETLRISSQKHLTTFTLVANCMLHINKCGHIDTVY